MKNFGMPIQMPMQMGMQMPMQMPMQMGMQMPMMGMGGMAAMQGMQGMNNQMMEDDEEWMKGFKMGVEEINNPGNDPDANSAGPKMNVLFTTTVGTSRNIVLSYGTTIDQALRKYLESVDKANLIGSDKISFLFNAAKLSFGDKTVVEKFFKNSINPKVVVNDTNNLIGA